MYFQDGYKLISAEQLLGALYALNQRQITFRAFRTFIASFEILAVREAAERSSGGRREIRSGDFFGPSSRT